jgi:hypothetical protein
MDWTQSPKITIPSSTKAKESPAQKSNASNQSLKMSIYVTCYSMKWLIFLTLNTGQAFAKSILPRSKKPSKAKNN